MNAQFIDRLLRCSDCQGEFIFTAGEQLFFQDKEFKNDPKRCKPCKSRRSGLAAVASGAGPAAAGLSRTETRTTCSECGVETTVPFKPTQGRPVLCRMCFQVKNRVPAPLPLAAAALAPPMTLGLEGVPSTATISALTSISTNAGEMTMSAEAALVAASSMASASPQSSVASAADLASIAPMPGQAEPAAELVPQTVVAAAASLIAVELASATVEVAEA